MSLFITLKITILWNQNFFEGAVYHQLQIVSQDNVSYLAMYSLIKDKGEWKISGCSIYPMEKQSI